MKSAPYVFPDEPNSWGLADDLYSSGSTHGTYSPFQFSARLKPELRDALKSIDTGVFKQGGAKEETILAFSTLFHEAIHWWQHIGSTSGLMLSFAYPAQCHANLEHLKGTLKNFGPKKSLKKYLDVNYDALDLEHRKKLNVIVNNWHDLEFNRKIILNPLLISA